MLWKSFEWIQSAMLCVPVQPDKCIRELINNKRYELLQIREDFTPSSVWTFVVIVEVKLNWNCSRPLLLYRSLLLASSGRFCHARARLSYVCTPSLNRCAELCLSMCGAFVRLGISFATVRLCSRPSTIFTTLQINAFIMLLYTQSIVAAITTR